MFRYGKRGGVLGVIAIVLAVVPMLVATAYLPQLGDTIPMRFDAAGDAVRWGSKYELLIAPALCLAVVIGTVSSAFRQAGKYGKGDPMAALTFNRFMRNAVMTGVVLCAVFAYIMYTVFTGHGFGIM